MVISTITSGLGNQLFQYALARRKSLQLGSTLYFDLRFYKSRYSRETNRSFKLGKFNISYKEIPSSVAWLIRLTKLFPRQSCSPIFTTLNEPFYHFDPQILEEKSLFLNLKGYWHSEEYFKDIDNIIRTELTFSNIPGARFEEFKDKIVGCQSPVSIHIRRGDYVHHPEFSQIFGFIGLNYYESAIEKILQTEPESQFFVFTDDYDWVIDNLKLNKNVVFVQNAGDDADLDDLQLMSLCKHNIIANSSFSWWGAWLNSNPNKIVIAPMKWFKNQPSWNTKDLLPKSWIKIASF